MEVNVSRTNIPNSNHFQVLLSLLRCMQSLRERMCIVNMIIGLPSNTQSYLTILGDISLTIFRK